MKNTSINLNSLRRELEDKLKKQYEQQEDSIGDFLNDISLKQLQELNKDYTELSLDDIFQLVLELRMDIDGDIYRISNRYSYDLVPSDYN